MSDKTENKIKSVEELAKIIAGIKNKKKKVVLCQGVFDLVHPGHLYHFQEAKKMGDVLVVGITADAYVNKGPERPIFNETIRAQALAALDVIDFVTVDHETSAVELLKTLKPDVYCKGEEYEAGLADNKRMIFKEAEAVKENGGHIAFTHAPTYSSTNLLKNHFDIYPPKTKRFLKQFSKKYSAKSIIKVLRRIREMKILVIGETIIDDYFYIKGMGKIPKDNLIAAKFWKSERFAGGVVAGANHLAGFSDNVHLVTVVGKKSLIDMPAEEIRCNSQARTGKELVEAKLNKNVTSKIFVDPAGQTIIKRRFLDFAFFTKMFEIYYFDDRPYAQSLNKQMADYLKKTIPNYDLVIINDYGHGFFNQKLINLITEKSKFLATSTQTNSANTGFNLITKYACADYVCIDHTEARLATKMKDNNINSVVKKLQSLIDTDKLVVTLGHEGAIATSKSGEVTKIPVLSTKVVDRMGAGDAFYSITAPCATLNAPMEIVGFIGNVIGALKVTTVGNKKAIEPTQVYKFIKTLLK